MTHPSPIRTPPAEGPTGPTAGPGEPCCTLDIGGADQEQVVKMFKALGHPIRFEILKFLVTRAGCITADIVGSLPLAQATVSQHLKVLREAGWLVATPHGTATCYEINEERVAWFRRWIDHIF